jgi:hypothetical protein
MDEEVMIEDSYSVCMKILRTPTKNYAPISELCISRIRGRVAIFLDRRTKITTDKMLQPVSDVSFTRVYPKVSGLAAWSEKCRWYTSLPLDAVVSLFCESV